MRFTRLRNNKGALTKTYSLDADGAMVRTTNADLYDGVAELVECADINEFMAVRSQLEPNEALMFGVTGRKSVGIVTREKLHAKPALRASAIARDRESVHYPHGPGMLLGDHDNEHLPETYGRDTLRAALLRAVPELAMAPMGWATSASSHITNSDTGVELQGLRGQRIYIPLADASDAPRVGKIIYERLWAAGIGAFSVSKSGALLDRNLLDSSAWQPERVDFAAGAKCVAPLVQLAPDWHTWEAEVFGGFDPWPSRDALPDLTDAQKQAAKKHRDAARALMRDEAAEVRAAYIGERAQTFATERGIDIDAATRLVSEAVERQLLFGEFVLYPEHGEPVTVGQVLDDPDRWHGTRFADPLEPTYRNDKRIAYCHLRSGGRPYLFSHAHGLGQRYELVRQPSALLVQPGQTPRLADECLAVMREHGVVYDFGPSQMVRVAGERVVPVTLGWLQDYLGRIVRFERYDARSKEIVAADAPERVAKAVFERSGERGLLALRALISAPTMRVDGSVLDQPGFDEASGLLYISDRLSPPPVPREPNLQAVVNALRTVMEPFQGFPFASPESRGVMVAAALSAVVRQNVPACPAFAFDAPAAGTGKTLIARCLAAIGGHDGSSIPPPGSDEEMRKTLFAALREGAGCVFIDNLVAPLGGAPVNQFLTEPLYSSRILGASEMAKVPNAALLFATGNNIRTIGDTTRRVLVCRLDAGVEQPYRRAFDFNALQWVVAKRHELVSAALTLLRGYITAGSPQLAPPLGSFEEWDRLVRQAVIWLGTVQTDVPIADPALTIDTGSQDDEHRSTLAAMLHAWSEAFGDVGATAAHALQFASGGDSSDDFESAKPKADRGAVLLAREALCRALECLEGERSGQLTSKRLSGYLRTHLGEIAGGKLFKRGQDGRGGFAVWKAAAV